VTSQSWAPNSFFNGSMNYLGANLRTAALEGHPWWKAAYYVFCIGIGVMVTISPDWTAHLGLLEARINIALLVAGILVPYYGFIYEVAEGDMPAEAPITMDRVGNFILASAIWVVALKARAKG